MDKSDREWVYAGISCVLAGALMSIISGKQRWFAMGGIAGAALVGYKYFERMSDEDRPLRMDSDAKRYVRRVLRDRPEFEQLGAPEIPATEVPNVGEPEPLTRHGVEGYPVAFRVPDVEVHIDTMDDKIRPHFVGPLGPENDPVRYW